MSHRFYLAELPETGIAVLDGLEAHHLMHVLRASAGDIIEVFNGAGMVASARVEAIRKRDATLQILASRQDAPQTRQVVLATAVPKGDRFDWLIEKSTELGITRIIPLVTARSVVDPRDSKLDKLRQTVVSACKQCGRNTLLHLSPVMAWADFIRQELVPGASFIAHPGHGAVDLTSTLFSRLPSIVLAVGPEGGFKDEEIAMAIDAKATAVGLGPRILRIETAGLALAALTAVG